MGLNCARQVLVLQIVVTELLPMLYTLAIGHHSHMHNSSQYKFWMVDLKDASRYCGDGCVQFQLADIIKTVPSASHISTAYFYYYEEGPKPSWSEYLDDPHAYEIFTVNHKGDYHQTITTFYPDCEEFYNTGWRAVEITHKIKHWLAVAPSFKNIRLAIRRVGESSKIQTRFKYDPFAKPLLLVGLSDYRENTAPSEAQNLHRNKRTTAITRACDDTSTSQPCCIAKELVDLRERRYAGLRGFWVLPEIFEFYHCLGTCANQGATRDFYRMVLQVYPYKQVCCNPKTREPFLVKLWGDGNNLIDGEIQNFTVTSCECS